MSDLIVLAFDTEADAFAARDTLIKAQSEYLIELEDAVVVTHPSADDYKLHQATNLTAMGALGGTFWGGLIGLLFLNPLLGAAVGAASGALAGSLTDYGINDDFMRDTSKAVPVGGAAVFVLSRKLNLDKLMPKLTAYAGHARIIQTSLSDGDEARLRDTLAAHHGGVTTPPATPAPAPVTESAPQPALETPAPILPKS